MVARKTTTRQVEDSLHEEAPADATERLRGELVERVERCDFDDDIAQRPIADIILDIRRDLGVGRLVGHDRFKRRTPADIAVVGARAAGRRDWAGLGWPSPAETETAALRSGTRVAGRDG